MSKSSYDSLSKTKFLLGVVLLILFYWIHIYSDHQNRDIVENYIIEQMLIEYPFDEMELTLEMKNKTPYEMCNNEYINSTNRENFLYCIAH